MGRKMPNDLKYDLTLIGDSIEKICRKYKIERVSFWNKSSDGVMHVDADDMTIFKTSHGRNYVDLHE